MPRSSRCCGRWSRSWARTRCVGWSGRPGPSWPAWPPGWAGRRPTRTATAPSPGSSSCCSACSDGSPSRPRSCWSSRTCTGPTAPPASCSPSWSGTCATSGSCWWPPTATTSRASRGWAPTWLSWTAARWSASRSPGSTGPGRPRSSPASWGAAPATDLADAVFARSQGNPFFTEELLAVVRAGSSDLPATPRDLLRGRVDALAEPARRVLAVVAVAGRQVPHRLLAAAAGLDDEAVTEGLRAAVAAQLLVRTGGQDGYDARHALLREVVEADLLPGG